jgi:hypothetical protein
MQCWAQKSIVTRSRHDRPARNGGAFAKQNTPRQTPSILSDRYATVGHTMTINLDHLLKSLREPKDDHAILMVIVDFVTHYTPY